jgi:hypothetical protein
MNPFTNRVTEIPIPSAMRDSGTRIAILEQQVAQLQNEVSFLRVCCLRLFSNDDKLYRVLTNVPATWELPITWGEDFIPFEKVTAPPNPMGWTIWAWNAPNQP